MSKPNFTTYTGIFIFASTTLMLEVLLTRVFSATLYYHLAFLLVSIALFGLSIGAMNIISFKETLFKEAVIDLRLSQLAFLYALSIFLFAVFLVIWRSNASYLDSKFIYALVALLMVLVPFVLSGTALSLLLTRFKGFVGSVYAADLVGAALGSLSVAFLINYMNVVPALFFIASIAAVCGVLFLPETGKRLKTYYLGSIIIFVCSLVYLKDSRLFYIESLKNQENKSGKLLFEKWNIYSRVTVRKDDGVCCWGLEKNIPFLGIRIDSDAFTPIIKYNGVLSDYTFLKEEITSTAHHLRPNSDVLIIGSGGGKDILTSLIFNQKSVKAIEINSTIVNLLDKKYSEYAGKITKDERVTLVNSEARSYLASHNTKYDLILISLIDTWATSASGAYSLTENGLYTKEATCLFLDRLKAGGVISVVRWYHRENPGELYRLVSLFKAGLKECSDGNKPPSQILVMGRTFGPEGIRSLANMLVSNKPFTKEDIEKFDGLEKTYNFDVVYSSTHVRDKGLETIITSDYKAIAESLGVNLTPPTDDSPYFFNMIKPLDILKGRKINSEANRLNNLGTQILLISLLFSLVMSCTLVLTPYLQANRKLNLKGNFNNLVYFMAIGIGFMLIEVSQLQRMSIFLGHPALGLVIILFSMLFSAGLGSLYSQRFLANPKSTKRHLLLTVGVLLCVGFLSVPILSNLNHLEIFGRSIVALTLLLPMGFVMGFGFPAGMTRVLQDKKETNALWMWGVNGAFSVLGSALAILLALSHSIRVAYFVGVLSYLLAFLSYKVKERNP
ncbi:MAG: hypothetical protein AAB443_01650 [Patescibacteria group bacterium]